jgi:hypothetical protein
MVCGTRSIELAVVLAILLLTCNGCKKSDTPSSVPGSTKPVAGASEAFRTPRPYRPLPANTLLEVVRNGLHLSAPASLGTPVMLTTQQPWVANAAGLYAWGASIFDPNYGPSGVMGNDSGNPSGNNLRFGIYVRQSVGQATVVDCDIAGAGAVAYSIQSLTTDGVYVDEVSGGLLQGSSADDQHWTVPVPPVSSGFFRLLLIPQNANEAELWGCQVTPID